MSSNAPFWVVWAPDFGPPRVRHDSEYRAQSEANRLARQSPGHEYFVLRAVSSTIRDDVRTTRLDGDGECDGIPF